MNYPATGYHHITACAGGAQEDVNFFTGVVGQRLAKQTVLMDGKFPHYHLYYSNAGIEPGSIMTTFPYSRLPGRKGSGQVSATAFTVAKGSLPFWQEHLKRREVAAMLREWERRHPGRIESICNAMGNVVPSHLLDRALHDFAAVRASGGADPHGDIAFDVDPVLDDAPAAPGTVALTRV